MSDIMRKFLTAYIEWIDAGAPDGKPFYRAEGLCDNTDFFDLDDAESWELYEELGHMFHADGLSRVYPFGDDAYDECAQNATQHLHKPRIDWVRSKLAA